MGRRSTGSKTTFGIVLVSGVGLKPDKVMETFGMVLGEMA